MPWSGWPAEWSTPPWNGYQPKLGDTAWTCCDLNASLLATMPPYLVGAAPSLDADWLTNPQPEIYASWEEFAKQLFWDYQLGEAFVLCTARYSTGYPARFHVVPPWNVNVEMDAGRRRYTIGRVDVTDDMLHVRYQGNVSDARGHGPLEAGYGRLVAADLLARYAANVFATGVPPSTLEHPDELSAQQAADLQAQWVASRMASMGLPAVLSGGVKWNVPKLSPRDMALHELSEWNEARVAVMLGVPPFMVGLPTGGDSMTYANVQSLFDFHWRAGLRPKASTVTAALSGWALPRATVVELNRDSYVQAAPLERAQTAEILNRIRDESGNPALTVAEIREVERMDTATMGLLVSGPVSQ